MYQCTADNGVKELVSLDINLTILCKYKTCIINTFFISIFSLAKISILLLKLFMDDVCSNLSLSPDYDFAVRIIIITDSNSVDQKHTYRRRLLFKRLILSIAFLFSTEI